MDILLDIRLPGDDRPLETRCRVAQVNGELAVIFQDTDADILHLLAAAQVDQCKGVI